ncbi:MAG: sulfurtransferase TusA family protein [Parasulfuritortus sp.]|nr:sulfurtransferase TusA family protein [Parasulfuritortus sp.]
MASKIEAHLDVCGVCCPLPLIQLAKAVKELDLGQTIEIIGNDPIFETSVRDFCQANGHTILDVRQGDNRKISILIQVGSSA